MARRPSCEGCSKPLRNDEDGLCSACLEPDEVGNVFDPYADDHVDEDER